MSERKVEPGQAAVLPDKFVARISTVEVLVECAEKLFASRA